MTGPPADPLKIVTEALEADTRDDWLIPQEAAEVALTALQDAGLLASGGSGEAPAGLTGVDLRALEVAVSIATSEGELLHPVTLAEKQMMDDALARLRAALRGPVGGEAGRDGGNG